VVGRTWCWQRLRASHPAWPGLARPGMAWLWSLPVLKKKIGQVDCFPRWPCPHPPSCRSWPQPSHLLPLLVLPRDWHCSAGIQSMRLQRRRQPGGLCCHGQPQPFARGLGADQPNIHVVGRQAASSLPRNQVLRGVGGCTAPPGGSVPPQPAVRLRLYRPRASCSRRGWQWRWVQQRSSSGAAAAAAAGR